MEKIEIPSEEGLIRWEKNTKKLFFKKDKDDEEKQLICPDCKRELFVIEGAFKRCIKCNSIFI